VLTLVLNFFINRFMYKNNKNAFGLLEIIVATSILTIAVFWVYKMIWENTKLINNSDNYIQMSSLFSSFENCIDYLKIDWNVWESYNFWFWNTWTLCFTWSSQKVSLDNMDYFLSWSITWTWVNYIDWKLQISNESVWEILKEYKYNK